MNLDTARYNMIENQLRPRGALDDHLLKLHYSIKREDFVPTAYQQLAFADLNIPLMHEQVMLDPQTEMLLLQHLQIKPTDHVLEVGTGTGFMTALLARLGTHVTSIDILPEFTTAAKRRLAQYACNNVTLETVDVFDYLQQFDAYDVIVVTGGLHYIPSAFKEALKLNGRLIVFVGSSTLMYATLMHRIHYGEWQEHKVFETAIPFLINAPIQQAFIL